MIDELSWLIPVGIIFLCGCISIIIYAECCWKKKIKSIKNEFNLVEGCSYNVIQNGGRTLKNLVFVRITTGNNSINGNINIIFVKNSNYRDSTIQREIVVKYGSIWKVEKLN